MAGALSRGIDILILLGSAPNGLEPAEIATRLRVPPSTVYRILRVLRHKGLVTNGSDGEGYRLGAIVLQWAAAVQRGFSVVETAAPRIRAIAEHTGDTVQLTVLSGLSAVTVDIAEGTAPVRVAPERGRALPLYCGAAAKAILAFLPEHRWQDVIRTTGLTALTRRTLTDPVRLRADLRLTRSRGYAISEEEVYEGARAVAAPLFDGGGAVCASIGVAGPMHRLRGERLKRVADLVVHEAASLSRAPRADRAGAVRKA